MRMKIEESIKKLKGQQADFNEQYIDYDGINDAFFTAYEVMQKYQKIQAIIANRESDENENAPQSKHIYMADAYMQIREVLEDGNVD